MSQTIIEVANTHGGSYEYMISLINEFESIQPSGMKFQPFKYDRIAVKKYKGYELYKKLFFNRNQWKEIIKIANETKEVWLDVFDAYGIDIFAANIDSIYGLKLQTSVLDNITVLEALKGLELNDKKIILNIAGRKKSDIQYYISYFQENYNFNEILLEIGFQSYPTQLLDSGISKIEDTKKTFKKRIVFADHIDGKDIHARILPLIAVIKGADIIEKHVMHSQLPTEYDYFSSINFKVFEQLISDIKSYSLLNEQPYINQNEANYLNSTIQIPILIGDREKGDLISIRDFDFKRTNKQGINYHDLISLLEKGVGKLKKSKENESPLELKDLSKIKTACIIAARLKSTRLKQKAKLKIGNLSSLEMCIKSCLEIDNIDLTVLATSDLQEDEELANYTYSPDVIFHKGHPDDVIQRYLDIIRKEDIDVIVRVTGDMPFVSKEIANHLLAEHFKFGNDYTVGIDAAVGTNVEIINSRALEKVKKHFPKANYSEYMTWYFQNNPDHFKINYVKLPPKLIRDYRLTLDYKEDLYLFNKIVQSLLNQKLEINTKNIFNFLDKNPQIANINSHLKLKYKTDETLIETLNKETKIN